MALRVSRDAFLQQMNVLRADGYDVVPLASVLKASPGGKQRQVAITFDDGYRDQRWAVELLRDFGFPATLFVTPRFLDGICRPERYWEQWEHLGWDDVAALGREGLDIGAHSATHPDLRTCTARQLDVEAGEARQMLSARLGRDVEHFSYPYGRHDGRVRRAVERAGYTLACTSQYGTNGTLTSPYLIQRTEISGTDDLNDFRWKLRGKYDWLAYWQAVTSWR
jgi:peptidoglycan/xylan/chitin deacetylase (PgdA/CDA1 family)